MAKLTIQEIINILKTIEPFDIDFSKKETVIGQYGLGVCYYFAGSDKEKNFLSITVSAEDSGMAMSYWRVGAYAPNPSIVIPKTKVSEKLPELIAELNKGYGI